MSLVAQYFYFIVNFEGIHLILAVSIVLFFAAKLSKIINNSNNDEKIKKEEEEKEEGEGEKEGEGEGEREKKEKEEMKK